jgi:Ca-activated chloride channel family protein
VSFGSPLLLLGLLAVPAAVAAYVLLERRRRRRAAVWAAPDLMPNMLAGRPGHRRHVPAALLLVALSLMLVGVARPEATFTDIREGATVVLAIDVSGSMAATDVRPTRIGAARAAVLSFLAELPSKYRVALVTFAATSAVRVPPTHDRDRVRAALPLKTRISGTAVGDAVGRSVGVAVRAVGRTKPGVTRAPATVLLISDGAQTAGQLQPDEAAERARRAGIPVSTVVVGTPRGVVEQELAGVPGASQVLAVPTDPTTLRTVARGTGGSFFQATTAKELRRVYEELGSRSARQREWREITAGVAGLALAFLVAAGVLSAIWFRRAV